MQLEKSAELATKLDNKISLKIEKKNKIGFVTIFGTKVEWIFRLVTPANFES